MDIFPTISNEDDLYEHAQERLNITGAQRTWYLMVMTVCTSGNSRHVEGHKIMAREDTVIGSKIIFDFCPGL